MRLEIPADAVAGPRDLILVTGASGFIGARVVETLLESGFRHVRAFVRPSSDVAKLLAASARFPHAHLELLHGNLLSKADCLAATRDAKAVLHLAAGMGTKSYPDAYMNSVVATRNLLDASVATGQVRRFVNVSSITVYDKSKRGAAILDESFPLESRPEQRGEAYSFAKVKQEAIVQEYADKFNLPCVTLRPGQVYGPGKESITGRVGVDTFGVFVHLGGSNRIPFTYVDNCAAAIVLAGLTKGVEGEAFNVVDDDPPTSRRFLKLYKRHVRRFRSFPCPRTVSYWFCAAWEDYSTWSRRQLPPAFSRSRWRSDWQKTRYTNQKLKQRLGWAPSIGTEEGLSLFFTSCREALDD